jgi:hypothetical protein
MFRSLCLVLISVTLSLGLSFGLDLVLQPYGPKASISLVTFGGSDLETAWGAAVKVSGPEGYGSGIEGRYRFGHYRIEGVLTAAHVVKQTGELKIEDRGDDGLGTRDCKVLWMDESADLAFLNVGGNPGPRMDLTPVSSVNLAEDVWYIGFGARTDKWLEKSVVNRCSWSEHRPGRTRTYKGFFVTGKGFYGSSGSAVLVQRNGRFHLAGIMSCWASDDQDCLIYGPLAAVGPKSIEDFLHQVAIRYGKVL